MGDGGDARARRAHAAVRSPPASLRALLGPLAAAARGGVAVDDFRAAPTPRQAAAAARARARATPGGATPSAAARLEALCADIDAHLADVAAPAAVAPERSDLMAFDSPSASAASCPSLTPLPALGSPIDGLMLDEDEWRVEEAGRASVSSLSFASARAASASPEPPSRLAPADSMALYASAESDALHASPTSPAPAAAAAAALESLLAASEAERDRLTAALGESLAERDALASLARSLEADVASARADAAAAARALGAARAARRAGRDAARCAAAELVAGLGAAPTPKAAAAAGATAPPRSPLTPIVWGAADAGASPAARLVR